MLPTAFFLVYFFLIGAALGSFAGVLVARLPAGRSIVRPGSECDHCQQPVRWMHNIPIISYVLLRGRCAQCGGAIGIEHWLLECTGACLAPALYVAHGWGLLLLVWLLLLPLFLAIVVLDLRLFWIPNALSYPAIVLAIIAVALPGGVDWVSAAWGLLPAVLLAAVSLGYRFLRGREGLGLGDIKLIAALGLLVGGIQAMTLLFLAALQGLLAALLMRLPFWPRRGETSVAVSWFDDGWVPPPGALPFGPFFILAVYEVTLAPRLFHGLLWGAFGFSG